MSESINVENKKQNRQKPPLNVGRIAGELLAGVITGLAVALLVVHVTGVVYTEPVSYGAIVGLGIIILVFPVYRGS